MSELCTHLEVGCTVETLGQFPSIEAEVASVEGLRMLFREAARYGYGTAIDQYVADRAVARTKTTEVPVVETVANPSVLLQESPRERLRKKRGIQSLLGRLASSFKPAA